MPLIAELGNEDKKFTNINIKVMEKREGSIEEFYSNKWFSHLSILLSGAMFVFISWGIKDSAIIDISSVSNAFWSVLSFLIASYIAGSFFAALILLTKYALNIYKSILAVAFAFLLFTLLFIVPYVSNQRVAANKYKKLLNKQMMYLDKDEKNALRLEMDEIEDDRNSWKDRYGSSDD